MRGAFFEHNFLSFLLAKLSSSSICKILCPGESICSPSAASATTSTKVTRGALFKRNFLSCVLAIQSARPQQPLRQRHPRQREACSSNTISSVSFLQSQSIIQVHSLQKPVSWRFNLLALNSLCDNVTQDNARRVPSNTISCPVSFRKIIQLFLRDPVSRRLNPPTVSFDLSFELSRSLPHLRPHHTMSFHRPALACQHSPSN
ncbi:hypothetical protein P170DRAFT_260932 [Aspergillus steynii IBT 23096]|uniref:Uncharacterized protein n=1 Tax=Aspergillus steynii IBT 23096 TaxID=1392250 RepID=A0A2I2FZQ7_9EURO|nr:uncharacterized protein P170DRAFT_260932 [Aspergillus steynii IBT 23096]PLB46122.1 hypothetical protein P170DRAFT_260932 [Aspergillus steynii IBT 23096]